MRKPSKVKWHPVPKHTDLMYEIDAMEILDAPLRTNTVGTAALCKLIKYWIGSNKAFKRFTFEGYTYIVRVR